MACGSCRTLNACGELPDLLKMGRGGRQTREKQSFNSSVLFDPFLFTFGISLSHPIHALVCWAKPTSAVHHSTVAHAVRGVLHNCPGKTLLVPKQWRAQVATGCSSHFGIAVAWP
jgi:hypothetical protein